MKLNILKKGIHIRIAVTSDISIDQRVQKIAETLVEEGHLVTVICRKLPNYPKLGNAKYEIKQRTLWFNRGFLFYASFNIMIFFDLLFSKSDLITANDLDTLPGCAFAALLKRKPLIYDSHELFLELPELKGKRHIKNVWSIFERLCIKKATAVSTVCDSIANELGEAYNKNCHVIRNVPRLKLSTRHNKTNKLPEIKTLLYQGSLNMGRGLEHMIGAMLFLYDAKLIIAGTGYMENALKQMVADLELQEKVEFVGVLSPHKLHELTQSAHLGFSLEENICKNYEFALPNKLFDYIQARVPVITTNLPEMKK